MSPREDQHLRTRQAEPRAHHHQSAAEPVALSLWYCLCVCGDVERPDEGVAAVSFRGVFLLAEFFGEGLEGESLAMC